MEFHLTFSGGLSSLLKFAQRHITLKTKGTPCLLKVICRKHSDSILIHRLQQRCSVRLKKDKLYITMQILQHLGVGGSIVEDHQDTEGETLICAILLQLMHQGNRAVHLENVSRHPTSGIGVPVDRQAGLFIAPSAQGVSAWYIMTGSCLQSPFRLAPSRRVKWSLNTLKP